MTDETTRKRLRDPTANGRIVSTAIADRADVVASALSDQVVSDPTAKTTIRRDRPDRDDPTETTRLRRPDQTAQATGEATRKATKRKRPDRDQATGEKRPRRPGRVVAWGWRSGRKRESVEAAARRAWLDDQGATVGIPRGYGWAFLALVVTTVVSAGSAFWFVFGNVTDTASMVGVPYEQQRAVSPAIDILVVGLTVYVQYLVMANGRAETIRLVRRLLVGASLIMLAMNATPPVLAALTTDYTGPLRRATESFTPTFDQMTTGQLWGRAGLDIVITGALVAWSHWGPRVVGGLAEIKARADRAALRLVEERTFATEVDRAEAGRLRAEATAVLEAGRAEATALVVSARAEATGLLDQAARDRQEAAAAARSATDTTAEADRLRDRAGRQAQETVAEAQESAERARRAVDDERAQLARDREQLAAQRAQLEHDRDQVAGDRRALEDLAAEVERAAAEPAPPGVPPSAPAPRPKPPPNGAPSVYGIGKPAATGTPRARRPKEETIALGVEAWKRHHGDEWWKVRPIKKPDVMQVCGTHSAMAMEIRGRLMAEADGHEAHAGTAE